MWLEEDEGERINLLRTDEVLSAGADIATVACPYCLTMLKDGVDHREAAGRMRVMDVAEVLQSALVERDHARQRVEELASRSQLLLMSCVTPARSCFAQKV